MTALLPSGRHGHVAKVGQMSTRFPLHAAAQAGDVPRVKELLGLSEDADGTLKAEDEDDLGRTALYMAATSGQKEICEMLLDCDPSILYHKAKGLYDNNVLHVAVSSGLSGDQDAASAEENSAGPAKNEFSKERKDAVVLLLLERQADVSARNSAGYTALHLAAGKGDVTAARWLIERGAEVDSKANNGHTPLFSAVCNAHRGMIAFLLNVGASAKTLDQKGESLLHAAALSRFTHHDSVKWLIEAGADPEARRKDGKTPLMVAFETIVESSINSLSTKEPYWQEDVEEWDEYSRDDPKFAAETEKESDGGVAALIASLDLDALRRQAAAAAAKAAAPSQ